MGHHDIIYARIATVTILLLFYLIFGGVTFTKLEEPNFKAKCAEMDHSVSNLLMGVLSNLTRSDNIHDEIDDMYKLFAIFDSIRASGGVARPTKAGPEELGDDDAVAGQIDFHIKCPDNWHFFDSFLFSLITITTIGYGNQTPQTASGQMFCVVYSIFGIPLIGFFVYYWTKGINHFDTLHFRKLFRSSRSTSNLHSHANHEDGDVDPNSVISVDDPARKKRRRTSKLLRIWIKVLTFFLFWYILPSTIFYFGEHGNWKWENAFYFCFITLSTIGFGDYTPTALHDCSLLMNVCYYVYIVLWILSGFVCTSVFLDRVTSAAKNTAKETTQYTKEGLVTLKGVLSKDLKRRHSENQQSDTTLIENTGMVFKQNSTPTKSLKRAGSIDPRLLAALRSQNMQEKAMKTKRALISSVEE